MNLSTVRDVVLDEADEMLNMGFTDSINRILEDVPRDRNTLLFSATMSKEIAGIAKNYLTDAHEIVIGNKNEGSKNVNHVYYMVHAKDKYAISRVSSRPGNSTITSGLYLTATSKMSNLCSSLWRGVPMNMA